MNYYWLTTEATLVTGQRALMSFWAQGDNPDAVCCPRAVRSHFENYGHHVKDVRILRVCPPDRLFEMFG